MSVQLTRKRKPGEFTEDIVAQKNKREYEHGEASFKINAAKSALLVIDMTVEFTTPRQTPLWVPESTKQLPRIKELIETCRSLHVPIIFTCFSSRKDMLDLNPYFKHGWTPADRYEDYDGPQLLCSKESLDPALRVNPEKDIVLEKTSYGSFTNTTLDYILKNLGVDTVIICGTKTNYCCGTTAREAHAHGYKVVFGSDVNSADEDSLQEAELKVLRRGFALVLGKDEITQALNGRGKYAETTIPLQESR